MTNPDDKSLLLVEDDRPLRERLARAMEARGFAVTQAESVAEGKARAKDVPPAYAVVDLKLGAASGLTCVQTLHAFDPELDIVVLTGFASIATAVEAIKLGARHYLAKPAGTDEIEAAFARQEGDPDAALSARPTSIKTLEWERIHEVLAETNFNISETARRLGMHRRTLARKLEKRQVT